MPKLYCFSLNGCISAACRDAPRRVRYSTGNTGQMFIHSSNGTPTKKNQNVTNNAVYVSFCQIQNESKRHEMRCVLCRKAPSGVLWHAAIPNATRCVGQHNTLRLSSRHVALSAFPLKNLPKTTEKRPVLLSTVVNSQFSIVNRQTQPLVFQCTFDLSAFLPKYDQNHTREHFKRFLKASRKSKRKQIIDFAYFLLSTKIHYIKKTGKDLQVLLKVLPCFSVAGVGHDPTTSGL